MNSITRMTNLMLEIPFRMLEAPFLMSAAVMDVFLDNTASESGSRREENIDRESQTLGKSTANHRRSPRTSRGVRMVSHSRKAA